MPSLTRSLVIGLLFLWSGMSAAPDLMADIRLPNIFADHMVVQRNKPIRIWGWADPGEKITIDFCGISMSATGDSSGQWNAELPPMKASNEPQKLTLQGNNRIELNDVLIGDVWLGSGQSNMEWPIKNTLGADAALEGATEDKIRLFHVPRVKAKQFVDDVQAKWTGCQSDAVSDFSAVLYHFGHALRKEVKVPIGLINSSWGGSAIEPWLVHGGGSGEMYNGMIAPIRRFSIRGVIWYQGETNVLRRDGLAYADKMKTLISGWRATWGSGLPFYFVQLAPWGGRYEPGELPAVWEAQAATLKIPATGMVVTTDLVDDIDDIHPRNKRDVGHRLARWALADSYRKKGIAYSGPMYRAQNVESGRIRIHFAHANRGLKSSDGEPLREFEIPGEDGQFHTANAEIEDASVVVHADEVTEPTQVRFGWHKRAQPNLINGAGLPASPFRSQNWSGGTGELPARKRAASNRIEPKFSDVSYGPFPANRLDFWQAPGPGPHPLLVYIHGGGWVGGNKNRNRRQVEEYLNKGISYAAIHYRLTGQAKLPAPVHDAARAIQYIRLRSQQWNVDPDRIALTGGSAGACTSMWILLHDDLADPKADDPVLRQSTRVCAAAVAGGQTSIDPKVIEGWLGPNVLKHRMIYMAVGEKKLEDALDNYDQHRDLYHEFSPYNHLDGGDPPLFMTYGNNMTFPSENPGHGIHHPLFGVKMKEKSEQLGHECHLLIKGVSKSPRFDSASEFLAAKLLAEDLENELPKKPELP